VQDPSDTKAAAGPRARRRLLGKPLPKEGEDGLFSKTWFPVCMSSELPPGGIYGTGFLDGRVVAYRGESGEARVVSAYCPHLGADLAAGSVVGENIRCLFHHWQFDADGVCVKTAAGDPPPAGACLFRFPTVEKHGIVWAFNGEDPHFDVPDFPFPSEELEYRVVVHEEIFPVDPWVICCNTPDIQHIKALHGINFETDPYEVIEWTDQSMLYNFKGTHAKGEPIEFRVGIYGTSIFYQSGTFNDRWYGYIAPFGIPAAGKSKIYYILAARKSEGDDASRQQLLDFVLSIQRQIIADDTPVLRSIHFQPGSLSQSDRALAKFFQYLRSYPRAHPSAEFIR
jgi:phenylpropionate dioxygenase-like ring-hydroxylating dioxygenase large terminal subunit